MATISDATMDKLNQPNEARRSQRLKYLCRKLTDFIVDKQETPKLVEETRSSKVSSITDQTSSVKLRPQCFEDISGCRRSIGGIPDTGFGKKGTDEKLPSQPHSKEHPHACRKRKSKQEAARVHSAVEPRRSSRLRGLSYGTSSRSEGKLNSTNFECYLENIWKELPEDKKNSYAYLDPTWFCLYTDEKWKPKVLSWIKNIHIFSKKYVFVPIVIWDHWCLLIFCHLGESLESDSRTPCMLLLDSLQMAGSSRFESEIRKFVWDIFNNEERPESQQLIRKIQLLIPKVPQQKNDKDCGKFVLYYISLFLESAPENFSISEGYPYFMKENWFTTDRLESFWQELQTSKDMNDSTPSDGSSSGSEDVIYLGSK